VANLLARPMDTAVPPRTCASACWRPTSGRRPPTRWSRRAPEPAWKADGGLRRGGAGRGRGRRHRGGALPPAATKPLATGRPLVVMLLGVYGAGRTTTAAKLGLAAGSRKVRTCAARRASAAFRAAAGEQLSAGARPARRRGRSAGAAEGRPGRGGVLVTPSRRGSAAAASLVLLDTAGRLHARPTCWRNSARSCA
jgi:hypothetical protein